MILKRIVFPPFPNKYYFLCIHHSVSFVEGSCSTYPQPTDGAKRVEARGTWFGSR